MAFCTKCGAPIEDGQTLCAACNAAEPAKTSLDFNKIVTNAGDLLENTVETILNTQDDTAAFDAQDIADNKIVSALSYIFVLFLIPMFAFKQSAFAQYHAKQGANLSILTVAANLVISLLGALLGGIPVIGFVIWLVAALIYAATLGFTLFGVIFTLLGKAKELPFISQIKIIK